VLGSVRPLFEAAKPLICAQEARPELHADLPAALSNARSRASQGHSVTLYEVLASGRLKPIPTKTTILLEVVQ
jgi:hypothetical protein